MFIRKYWLPISVFLVAICAVSLYFLRPGPDLPEGPVVIYKKTEPTSEHTTPPAPEGAARQPPVGETSEGGDGEASHAEPHEAQKNDAERSFTPEELVAMDKAFYKQQGLKPPPRGYQYLYDGVNQVRRDEAGTPVLHKIGDPVVTIRIEKGFAPTREQLQRYDQLIDVDLWQAEQDGDTARAAEIAEEIKQLELASRGDVPVMSYSLMVPGYMDYDVAERKADKMAREALYKARREMGLEHLNPENRFRTAPEE